MCLNFLNSLLQIKNSVHVNFGLFVEMIERKVEVSVWTHSTQIKTNLRLVGYLQPPTQTKGSIHSAWIWCETPHMDLMRKVDGMDTQTRG